MLSIEQMGNSLISSCFGGTTHSFYRGVFCRMSTTSNVPAQRVSGVRLALMSHVRDFSTESLSSRQTVFSCQENLKLIEITRI